MIPKRERARAIRDRSVNIELLLSERERAITKAHL